MPTSTAPIISQDWLDQYIHTALKDKENEKGQEIARTEIYLMPGAFFTPLTEDYAKINHNLEVIEEQITSLKTEIVNSIRRKNKTPSSNSETPNTQENQEGFPEHLAFLNVHLETKFNALCVNCDSMEALYTEALKIQSPAADRLHTIQNFAERKREILALNMSVIQKYYLLLQELATMQLYVTEEHIKGRLNNNSPAERFFKKHFTTSTLATVISNIINEHPETAPDDTLLRYQTNEDPTIQRNLAFNPTDTTPLTLTF